VSEILRPVDTGRQSKKNLHVQKKFAPAQTFKKQTQAQGESQLVLAGSPASDRIAFA
jgi:hypothetical protein